MLVYTWGGLKVRSGRQWRESQRSNVVIVRAKLDEITHHHAIAAQCQRTACHGLLALAAGKAALDVHQAAVVLHHLPVRAPSRRCTL